MDRKRIDTGQKQDRKLIENRFKVDRNQIATIQNYQIENGQELGRKCEENISNKYKQ